MIINNKNYSGQEVREALKELGYRFEMAKLSFWSQCGCEDCEEIIDVEVALLGDEKPSRSNQIYSVACKEFTIRPKPITKPKLTRQTNIPI